MAVVTATSVELTDHEITFRDELERLDREIEAAERQELRFHAAGLDAVDAINIAVGEFALTLEPDDPRRPPLGLIQDGLDALWSAGGGTAAPNGLIDRARLAAAFDAIGHQGSSSFRARVANAYARVSS